MKRTLFKASILVFAMIVLCFSLASCVKEEEVYMREDIDGFIASLNEEIVAKNVENKAALDALKAEYEAKVAEIEAANSADAEALATLKAEYEAKVAEINAKINTEISEIEALIDALEATDIKNTEAIAALELLVNKIIADISPLLEKYTVTFDTNGGSAVPSQTILRGGKIKVPVATTRSGYTFDGWYYGEEKWSFIGYSIAENITLTAKWSIDTYSISYVNADAESYPTSYTVEDRIILPTAVKKDYTFDGWFTDASFENQITEIVKGTTGAITLYAKFSPLPYYNITYHIENGTNNEGNKATFTVDDANAGLTLLDATPTVDGYYFIGWYTDSSFTTPITKITALGNIDLYAKIVDRSEGLVYGLSSDSSYYSVLSYRGTDTTIVIPLVHEDKPVKEIGGNAFNSLNIKKVIIPDSVTSIGYSAFEYCKGLTSITIPSNVTSIGDDAFSGCTGLTSITIPSSVTSIGGSAFDDCKGLENVSFEANSKLESIGDDAFSSCTGLTSITIPSSVTSIGGSAFYYCTGLENVSFEANSKLESIGSYAFQYCFSLKSITIPDSVTSIGSYAFDDCKGLENVSFEANSKLESIGYSAFLGCSSLSSITIPNSVISICVAFSGCTSLESITFEDISTWYITTNYDNWQNHTGGTQIDVTNTSMNAIYFKATYVDYYWYKE